MPRYIVAVTITVEIEDSDENSVNAASELVEDAMEQGISEGFFDPGIISYRIGATTDA